MGRKKKYETFRNYLKAFYLVRGMLREQWLSREQIESLQNKKLQKLVMHAYEKVSYYRKLLDQTGIRPEMIKTVRDLPKIPVTSREDIRKIDPMDITSQGVDISACYIKMTSGSSGIPLTTLWDDHALCVYYSTCVRSHHVLNCRLTDKFLCIGPTYYPCDLLPQRLGICAVKLMSPFSGPDEHIKFINSYQPDIIFCYPSVLKSLIHFVKKNTAIKIYSPRLITTSGEFLDDQTRAEAGELFGSAPAQFYGSWEIGRIGNECIYRNGIHLNEDIIIPEFIPAGAVNGQKCYRIILTNLYNYIMPFIRYDQGDLVQPIYEDCICGRKFLRIKMLDSRVSDVISLPNGTCISALHLAGMLFNLPGVSQFRIVQEAVDRLVIKVVPMEGFSASIAKGVLKKVDSLLPGIHAVMEEVHAIERDQSGKFRHFQSMLI